MTVYYVSTSGNDTNDGLTEATPWASLAKVKTFPFVGGDEIRFKRGETFYGRLTFDGPTFTSEVIVGTYGFGKKPVISGYKVGNNASSWTQHTTNVWKIDLTANGTYTGNRDTADTNVGFLNLDNKIYGYKKKTLAEVTSAWQFYCDSTYLYVYATANPTTLVSNIEIAINITLVNKRNNLTVKDLEITGSGGHGVGNAGNGVKVINCDIHAIGGSYLPNYGDGTTRFGNGIEFFNNGKDILIEFNNIYDVYDVAFTMQGLPTAPFENVIVKNNIIWNCTQTFEVWMSAGDYSKFLNCFFEDNICINAGYGWGYDVRPDQGTPVHLLLYNLYGTVNDITVRGNVFYNPRGALYYGSANLGYTIPYKSDNNYIFLREGQKIHMNKTYTVEQSASFIADLNQEKNSKFYTLTDTPVKLEDILSNIQTTLGANTGQVKSLQNAVGALSSRINDIKQSTLKYRDVGEVSELSHLTGYLKPAGGYVTNATGTLGTFYAPLGKINITSTNTRFDMTMSYMLCGDGAQNRNGFGILNLQIIPTAGLTAGTYVDIDVVELLPFTTGPSPQDFVAVI